MSPLLPQKTAPTAPVQRICYPTTWLAAAAVALLPWMTLGQGVPKAVPVDDDPPVPKAVPVSPDEARRAVPATPVPPPRPKGPDEDLFDYASLAYERGEWSIAAESLGRYLQEYPSGRHVATALFRIGECYMKQNQLKAAETYYEEVVKRYPESEGAPSAAYRLGALKFNARDFDQSARMFSFSESRSPLPQVRLAASFNKARAYQMLGDTKRQTSALNAVLAVKTDNPYREAALLSLGTLLLAADKKNEALPLFTELLKTTKDNAVLSEAAVKAGVLHAELGRPEEAVPLFEQALKIKETSDANRGIALVGVVQALFAKGDYDGVINNYNANAA
ncbi:MAG: tetratricopeptide repeat protein, partial [Prosthecobacter sp.]|nr:tetratricopeptide repeat protein [Prosthecobacter sp.]